MSIDPVQGSKPGIELKTPEKKVHAAPVPPSAASGNTPKAEIVKPQIAPLQPIVPEHEVELQLDTSAGDVIVYRVLDKQSGSLVLQVPSAEQLRGIEQTQELLQQIGARGNVSTSGQAAAPVVKGEGSNHGGEL
jgi:predicted PhzF superfamily epimerase YddE/YHI9